MSHYEVVAHGHNNQSKGKGNFETENAAYTKAHNIVKVDKGKVYDCVGIVWVSDTGVRVNIEFLKFLK